MVAFSGVAWILTGFPQSWKILENPEKKVVMEKSWKIAKIQNVIEICLPGKKSWKSHGNQLSYCVVINVDRDFIPWGLKSPLYYYTCAIIPRMPCGWSGWL